MINTPTQTAFRFLVFFEDDTWYAVALELGLVVDAETPDKAFASLLEAIEALTSVWSDPEYAGSKFHIPKVEPEYERMWELHQKQNGDSVKSPYQISMSGIRQVA